MNIELHETNGLRMLAIYIDCYWGEVQDIKYSIVREMAPIYTLPDEPIEAEKKRQEMMRERAKRRIAGTLKFKWCNLGSFFRRVQLAKPPAEDGPWYPNDMQPFDIIFIKQDEYGKLFSSILYQVEILNEGYSIPFADINDNDPETRLFCAQYLFPWTPVKDHQLCRCTDSRPGRIGPYTCWVCHGTGVNLRVNREEQ